MDKNKALQLMRKQWTDADSIGLPAMRALKANVCAYDFVVGADSWFHKTNIGQGDNWSMGHGHCPGTPDIVVNFVDGFGYPDCFAAYDNLEDLIGAFRAAAQKGLITYTPQRDMSILVDKGYDKMAEALALQVREDVAAAG